MFKEPLSELPKDSLDVETREAKCEKRVGEVCWARGTRKQDVVRGAHAAVDGLSVSSGRS